MSMQDTEPYDFEQKEQSVRLRKRRSSGAGSLAKRVYRGPARKRALRLARKLELSQHRYKRSFSLDLQVATGGGIQSYGYEFRLDQLPGFGEFTALYDSYRIEWVTVWAMPTQDNAPVQGSNYFVPTLLSVVDKDDATAPATLASVLEHGNVKYNYMNGMKKIAAFRPAIAADVFQSAIATGYSRQEMQWIDCAKPSVPHYGLKTWQEPAITGYNGIRLIADVYVSFKDTR